MESRESRVVLPKGKLSLFAFVAGTCKLSMQQVDTASVVAVVNRLVSLLLSSRLGDSRESMT